MCSTAERIHEARGVYRIPLAIVNAYMIALPDGGDRGWVLVDAGLSWSRTSIVRAAAEAFGLDSRPAAILLTHGHFDHVGSVQSLARMWDAPVFAHPLELPYLTGRSDYPPPDPAVGGGAMAWLSPVFSRSAIDLGDRIHALDESGAIPYLPGWRWIHTPGHTPGHVSFFRDEDRVLVAGDAFVTTKQESMLGALLKPEVVHGPPAYFTSHWAAARDSVRRLAALAPRVAATGHGRPMQGPAMVKQLNRLAARFDQFARPEHGRYVSEPARADATGVIEVPPPVFPPIAAALAVGMGAAIGALMASPRE